MLSFFFIINLCNEKCALKGGIYVLMSCCYLKDVSHLGRAATTILLFVFNKSALTFLCLKNKILLTELEYNCYYRCLVKVPYTCIHFYIQYLFHKFLLWM